MNYAIIENGIVTNIIVADATFAASVGAVPAQDAGIGWSYAGGVFTAPAPAAPQVPQTVTRRQAKQALVLAGKLDAVQPAIDLIPDPQQRQMVQIEWDDSQEFQRNRYSVIGIGVAIGLNSAELDDLFITAATL